MIKKIKTFILSSLLAFSFVMPAAVPLSIAAVSAASGGCSGVPDQIARGAEESTGGGTINCDDSSDLGGAEAPIAKLAKSIVNIFSIIVGAASVVMIIYGGFRYITSGGDSNRVGNAKNTLIYAIVGLIIVALAQVIVQFVISKSTSATSEL